MIPTNSDYNFTFPFTIRYDTQSASSSLMLNTLLTDCGLYGGEQSDIHVDYTIQLAARVLFVTIHPNLSGSTSFACPLSVSITNGLNIKCINTQGFIRMVDYQAFHHYLLPHPWDQ